jgi:hypothetical protein
MKRTIFYAKKYVLKKNMAIWVLSTALFFSVIINIFQLEIFFWIKKPFTQQVILNEKQEMIIDDLFVLKKDMQFSFIQYQLQKNSIFDPLQDNMMEKNRSMDSLLLTLNEYSLGGGDDKKHKNNKFSKSPK